MSNLKITNNEKLSDWAKDIFENNSYNMVDVSEKKSTFRRALASGKIFVGEEVFNLIQKKQMPKGDPISLAEISAKFSNLYPLVVITVFFIPEFSFKIFTISKKSFLIVGSPPVSLIFDTPNCDNALASLLISSAVINVLLSDLSIL